MIRKFVGNLLSNSWKVIDGGENELELQWQLRLDRTVGEEPSVLFRNLVVCEACSQRVRLVKRRARGPLLSGVNQ
jgi:hypothetical protein